MRKEKLSGLQLPIIGNHDFELTEEDVKAALKDVRLNIEEWEEHLNDDERTRDSAERVLPRLRKQKDTLSADPKMVLARVREFYDNALALERSGSDRYNSSEVLYDRFPDLGNYQRLLRMKTWGANLADLVIATQSGRQIRGRYRE